MAPSKKKPQKKKKPATAKPSRVSASKPRKKSARKVAPKKPVPKKKPSRKAAPKKRTPARTEPKKKPSRKAAPKKRTPAPKKKPAPKKRPQLTKRQKAARKAARTRERNRLERESIELSEAARVEVDEEAAARRAAGDERQLMIDVLEEMRDIAAGVTRISLDITEAEVGARIPWLVVGAFECLELPSYAQLGEVFAVWRDDLILEARIHPQRLSQIRIVYADPNAKRGESDSIIAHMGPWEAVISETAFEVGTGEDDQEESLSLRYKETKVPTFYVYFSGRLASEVEISL